MNAPPRSKVARANLESLRRIFTLPEESSTLSLLEAEISQNLIGFLSEHIASGDMDPQHLEKDFLDSHVPENPIFVSDHTDWILEKVVSQSVHTASPSFIGHMTSAVPYFMLPLAKIMMALKQNLVKIETSKAFTPLARQVIGMLHHLVYGFDDEFYGRFTQAADHALGSYCSGGTVANITALWVARNRMLSAKDNFQGVAQDGLAAGMLAHGYKKLAVLVSKRGHYSLRKACDLLGIGRNQVIPVAVDHRHKIDMKALGETVADLRKNQVGILALVGIAGTTETGHVDPLDELADLAETIGCHFHVDAAWGGPTLFSDRYRHLLKGIERADSVTFDAHKQLYVPVGAGICLYKDPDAAGSIAHHAQYVIRKGSRDLGKHTLEGSRPGTALLVHAGLCIMGRKGYEILVDLGIGKAGQFAKMIRGADTFELVTEPELNLLTYRYVPRAARELLQKGTDDQIRAANEILSDLTEQIQKIQRARGKTFVSRTRLEASRYHNQMLTVFRVALANPLTTRQILNSILEEQTEYGEKLVEESFGQRLQAVADLPLDKPSEGEL